MRPPSAMLQPAFQPLLLALVIGLLAWRESHEAWFAPVQQHYVDWLQANADGARWKAPLFLVEIPDAKTERAGWQPVDYALALNTLAPLQSAVLAIAPVLHWDAAEQDANLRILHDQLLAARKPLLSAQLGLPEDPDIAPAIEAVPALRKIAGNLNGVPEYPAIVGKADETLRLAGATGFLAEGADADPGTWPLLFRYHGQVIPSFVLQAVVLWSGSTLDEVVVNAGESIRIGSTLRIPIDAAGRMALNPRVDFGHAKFDDVMLGITQMQAGQRSEFQPGAWQKNLVLLARARSSTAPAEALAEALATITTQAFPRQAGLLGEALCLLPACWLAALFSGWRRERAIVVAACALLGAVVLVLTVYGSAALVLPLLAPALVVVVGLLVAVLPRRAG